MDASERKILTEKILSRQKVRRMSEYQISLNQMADLRNATDKGRRRIIRQQLSPDIFRIPWYQKTKACIKKSIKLKGDLTPVYKGIQELNQKKPKNARQEIDKRVSLEALEHFINLNLPPILYKIEYSGINPETKSTIISDVEVIIAPEVIIKGELNGNSVLGAVKIHISKNKPFDLQQARTITAGIVTYLENEVAEDKSEVLPELCFCLDVFSDRMISAKDNDDKIYKELHEICELVKELWNEAAA